MANPKWGTKRTCLGCGKRFYDMRREPIICPACNAPFESVAPVRPRRQRAPVAIAPAAPPPQHLDNAESEVNSGASEARKVEADGVDDIVEVKEKVAETLEDPSEMGEDEDDMVEVIDGMEETKKVDA